jgi:hypothetical protein
MSLVTFVILYNVRPWLAPIKQRNHDELTLQSHLIQPFRVYSRPLHTNTTQFARIS